MFLKNFEDFSQMKHTVKLDLSFLTNEVIIKYKYMFYFMSFSLSTIYLI